MTLISAGVLCHLQVSDLPLTWRNFEAMLLTWEIALLLSYGIIIFVLIDQFREINKKFGSGNLWKMLMEKNQQ